MRFLPRSLAALLLMLVLAGCASSGEVAVVTDRPEPATVEETPAEMPEPEQTLTSPLDTVQAGRFDFGKMWTFDHPPIEYFEEAYGFRPDSTWFERARLGALRFSTYCSASFVSPNGLVLTNHHCGRQSVTDVSEAGEELLDSGFYAGSLEEERKVEDLYVDQLIDIEDVSAQVFAAVRNVGDDEARAEARQNTVERIQEEMTQAAKQRDSTLHVQVIELYNGGMYSAYTFRRYEDVRLVMAPELQLGFFGGDPDNFTYPRYSLDMALFRVYGPDGEPLETEYYFPVSETGSEEGEVVFVVGNPGTTSRLSTVSQLEFERDFTLPQQLAALERRAGVLQQYIEANPEKADEHDVRNTYFSISNSIKANTGQLEGLRDPYLIARRAAAERTLQQDITAVDSLRQEYGGVLEAIAELQKAKRSIAPRQAAFTFFGSGIGSHVLTRALYGYYYDMLKRRGLPPQPLEEIRNDALEVEDLPAELEQELIAIRLEEVRSALGPDDPTVQRVLQGQTPEGLAAQIVENTALLDSTRYAEVLESGYLSSGDPTVPVIEALAPLYFQSLNQLQSYQNREENLNAQLARARFELYGTSIPPDASFSLRLADGVIKGYTYNGTYAPPYTTYYGLYNHHFSYPGEEEWDLPARWLPIPEGLDLSTPLNLVSTNDITGGNSGSPLLNQDLEVVGLVFDGNIESLPNQYLYRDEQARTVSVDIRGILEALDDVYDADRIVLELVEGELVPTEEEADAVGVE